MMSRVPVFALASLLAVVVSGCGSPSAPDLSDAALVDRRTEAIERARAALAEVVSATGGDVLGRASYDGCYEGQQNWKVDEGYAHRCTVRQVVAVGFAGDFRRHITQLDERLLTSGWSVCSTCDHDDTLSSHVEEYWDLRVSHATDEYPFSISQLPTPGQPYEQGDLQLTFDYGDRDGAGRSLLESSHRMGRGSPRRTYERSQRLDVDAVLAGSSSDEHIVVAAIEVDYFEN